MGDVMDIENFLASNLVDLYCQYCEVVNDMSNDEVDEMLDTFTEEGLTDIDVIREKKDEILIPELIDGLYSMIVDLSDVKEINLDYVLSYLVGIFYVYKYDEEKSKSVINFLKDNSFDNIKELFIKNDSFGIDLVNTYGEYLVNSEKYNKNRKVIYENKDEAKLEEFEQIYKIQNIITLNNLLRKMVVNLYNNYIKSGCDDITSLSLTWQYFFSDLDPLGELEQYGVDDAAKAFYKRYVLNLIYADLYEDICNGSIISSDNYDVRMANLVPLLSVESGVVNIPLQEWLRNRILKHFVLLQGDYEKRVSNRKKTIEEDRVLKLKKVNPFYQLDGLTL